MVSPNEFMVVGGSLYRYAFDDEKAVWTYNAMNNAWLREEDLPYPIIGANCVFSIFREKRVLFCIFGRNLQVFSINIAKKLILLHY